MTNGLTYFVQTPDWTAFCYAGQLCGNAFSVNRFGVGVSSNQLWPLRTAPLPSRRAMFAGVATNFALRAIVGAASPAAVVKQLVAMTPFLTGFSANAVGAAKAFNVEAAFAATLATTVTTSAVAHFNLYEFIATPQLNDTSSTHRAARFAALEQNMTHVDGMIELRALARSSLTRRSHTRPTAQFPRRYDRRTVSGLSTQRRAERVDALFVCIRRSR